MPDPKTKIAAGVDRVIARELPGSVCDEASLAVHPANPLNLIAAASAYTGPDWSKHALLVWYSLDGGLSWSPSALPTAIAGGDFGSPMLAFDVAGTAYLLVVKSAAPSILKSINGGKAWTSVAQSTSIDMLFPWMAADRTRGEKLYAITSSAIPTPPPYGSFFYRSEDGGKSWKSRLLSDEAGGDVLLLHPQLCVATDGTVHVLNAPLVGSDIRHWRSTDGGVNFTAQRAGLVKAFSSAYDPRSWRVASCVAPDGRLVMAWADSRDGVSRIYYRVTDESGKKWLGPEDGSVLDAGTPTTRGHFQPCLSVTGNGVIGCAFFALTAGKGGDRVQLMLAPSFDLDAGFEAPITISDADWSQLELVRYFGMNADATSFLLTWPDTRTGAQALYFDRVVITPSPRPFIPHDEDITIHITSETWIVIHRRRGKILDIVRVPGRPGGTPSDVARVLRTFEARRVLQAGQRTRPRITRALSDALDVITEFLPRGKKPRKK